MTLARDPKQLFSPISMFGTMEWRKWRSKSRRRMKRRRSFKRRSWGLKQLLGVEEE